MSGRVRGVKMSRGSDRCAVGRADGDVGAARRHRLALRHRVEEEAPFRFGAEGGLVAGVAHQLQPERRQHAAVEGHRFGVARGAQGHVVDHRQAPCC
jgi:hypothetical protein